MKTMDKKELYELDSEMLEKVAAGVEITEMEKDEANMENPLVLSLCVTAALAVVKIYGGSLMPETFEKFYDEIYLPNSTAIDIAMCASVGVVGTAAYMACDKKRFWKKVYDALA